MQRAQAQKDGGKPESKRRALAMVLSSESVLPRSHADAVHVLAIGNGIGLADGIVSAVTHELGREKVGVTVGE